MFAYRHQKLVVELTRVMAIAVALLMLTVLTVSRSQAAFSDTTDNTGIAFATGTVVLTDDDGDTGTPASALFNASGMSPGTSLEKCIEITYSGDMLPADIKMYGTSSGTLAPYLTVKVEVGTGGDFSDCTGFVGAQIYNNKLNTFSGTHTNWTNGLAGYTATATPGSEVRVFRFTVDVDNVTAAQGKTANASFTWEAQDT